MHIKNNYLFKALLLCLLLLSDRAKCDFNETELNVAAMCLTGGFCDGLVQCPYNRACFNACDIGFDRGGTARQVASYFGAFLGMSHLKEFEGDYQVVCRGDCISNLVSDCQKEQPIDITVTAPSTDPARNCREYCGSKGSVPSDPDKILFPTCESTCRNFDQESGRNYTNLAECYRLHATDPLLFSGQKDPKTGAKVCDPEELGIIANPNSEFEKNRDNVRNKMRGFAQEALCQTKKDAAGCGADLCTAFAWSRSCGQAAQERHQKMVDQKKKQQDGIIDYSTKALIEYGEVVEARKRAQGAASDLSSDIDKAIAQKAAEKAAEKKASETPAEAAPAAPPGVVENSQQAAPAS